ncbi:hypothetical protein JCM24511_00006 [Saitozyma sp. JCM 24511]|nr:hypothetical protein JCM24511_00006 [Saitozyma sp. JCM 24511]
MAETSVTNEFWSENLPRERKAEIESAVKAVEGGSTHLLAKALVEHLGVPQSNVEIVKVVEVAGRGLTATVRVESNTTDLLVGNLAPLVHKSVLVPAGEEQVLDIWSERAKSAVLVAVKPGTPYEPSLDSATTHYSLAAMFALADPPIPTKVFLSITLSGDNVLTAIAFDKSMGFEEANVKAGATRTL